VDDYHIRLNLQTANIGVPEHLFHYPAIVMHRNFEGDIIKGSQSGPVPLLWKSMPKVSGPYFKRREDYWQMGEDGSPLPYLDELVYVSTDKDAGVAALQSGQVDTLYDPRPNDFLALKMWLG
jgi:peptide/nickel transport system substrate-binding protein